jgi:hypothetical protein
MRALIIAALIGLAGPAWGQDKGDWFENLRQPKTGYSCCSIADCAKAEADFREGQWWAIVSGQWTPIPPDKELETQSFDGNAYVCSSPSRKVYCFVRPDFGT